MTKITIPDAIWITKKEYDRLMKDSSDLAKLHAGGVDNWEWCEADLLEVSAVKKKKRMTNDT